MSNHSHSTKLKKKKHLPAETVAYLENIIALMPGHVYWKDLNGIMLGCNDEQARDMGLSSREQAVGLTPHDTLPKELADSIIKTDAEVIQKGISQTIEETLKLANGKKSIWLSKKQPLRDKNDKIIGLVGISFDITEHKKTKKKLERTKIKLKAMTTVSAGIAHELRTPLASLNLRKENLKANFLFLMEHCKENPSNNLPTPLASTTFFADCMNDLENMEKEIQSAHTVIDMLLMNLQPKLSKNHEESFSIFECLKEAMARYPFDPGEKEWVHFNNRDDFSVHGQQILFVHLFFNLFKNALYSIAAAGKGEINIWAETTSDHNKLYFKDTGMGIAKKVRSKIFNRFFSQTLHGAGIGLTFCKMVMQSLGGEMTCESTEGEYTTFILLFPKH